MALAEAAIAVVGSLNLDLVVRVSRLPGRGETVSGDDVFRNPGGKRANQAVAAARLGRGVAMVGRVGGRRGRARAAGVAGGGRGGPLAGPVVDGVPTGTAFSTVAEDGENQIVVSPGANARLTPDDVAIAGTALAAAAVTLLQLEVPLEAVAAARHVPAVPVRPVDTTAAGDAFCGGLADALAAGATLEDAARRAVRVAAAACLRQGAQASLPTPADLRALPDRPARDGAPDATGHPRRRRPVRR